MLCCCGSAFWAYSTTIFSHMLSLVLVDPPCFPSRHLYLLNFLSFHLFARQFIFLSVLFRTALYLPFYPKHMSINSALFPLLLFTDYFLKLSSFLSSQISVYIKALCARHLHLLCQSSRLGIYSHNSLGQKGWGCGRLIQLSTFHSLLNSHF